MDFYFQANDVQDAGKKRALLLTLCGAETYNTVRALVAPHKPGEVSFNDIMTLLGDHYDPRPSELFCRSKFQRRDQHPGESIACYVAALKKLATDCNFGVLTTATSPTTTAGSSSAGGTVSAGSSSSGGILASNPTMLPLDVMLRDRFVCGVQDERIQQRLFAEQKLTFKQAYDIAIRLESAVKQQQELKLPKPDLNKMCRTTNRAATTSTGQPEMTCYRCNEQHSAETCRFRKTSCRFCRKTGHIEKACRIKARSGAGQRSTNLVSEDRKSVV